MAYTADSGRSQLIAGPLLSTLSSADNSGAAFVTPEKPETSTKRTAVRSSTAGDAPQPTCASH